jgi:hypothetical protein
MAEMGQEFILNFSWFLPFTVVILLYISLFLSRRIEWAGHAARMGDRRESDHL